MEEYSNEDVPSLFLCPISLQMMKDPVIISTGITFERRCIQKWFASYKKTSCPVTMQLLTDFRLTPYSNLQRLIQSWKLENASDSNSTSRKPSLKEEMAFALRVTSLLEDLEKSCLQVKALRAIRSLFTKVNEEKYVYSRASLKEDDLFRRLSCLVCDMTEPNLLHDVEDQDAAAVLEEALSVLCLLKPEKQPWELSLQYRNGLFVNSLCSIISSCWSQQAKIRAVLLLNPALKSNFATCIQGLSFEFFESLAEILKDQNSMKGSQAVLQILVILLSHGRNAENATNCGLVPVLVELMAEDSMKTRHCEMRLVIIEKLCRRAQGREALVSHPLGIAAVLSKTANISHLGNSKAISVLTWVFRFCNRSDMAVQFMELGGASKLHMVLQSGCSTQTKQRAKEILTFYLREWNKSPCFPSTFPHLRTEDN